MTTNQEYKDIYTTLSNQKKEVLSSPELSKTIDSIAYSRHLSVVQRNAIALVIKDLLYGIESFTNAPQKIEENALIDELESIEISKIIETNILNNLDSIEQQIRLNIQAENLLNGIEDDFEEEVNITKSNQSRANNDQEESYISEWSNLFSKNPPQQTNSFERKAIAQKIRSVFLSKQNTYTELEKLLPEYSNELQKNIKDFIFSPLWFTRSNEIALKYSLNENQVDTFIGDIFSILIGLENGNNFLESLVSSLDVSRILAEQICEDSENRIFKYGIENLEKSSTSNPVENTLDVPPVNLPGEVIEESSNSWIPKTVPANPEKTHSILQDQVNNFFDTKEVEAPVVAAAPSSFIRPIETPLEEPIPQKPQSFISQKLSQPTAPQKYTADPYREPIE